MAGDDKVAKSKGIIAIKIKEPREKTTLEELLKILEGLPLSADVMKKVHEELRGVSGKEFVVDSEGDERLQIPEEIKGEFSHLTFLSIDEMAEILCKATELQRNFSRIITETIESLSEKIFKKAKGELTIEERMILSQKIIEEIKSTAQAKKQDVPDDLLSQLALRIIGR